MKKTDQIDRIKQRVQFSFSKKSEEDIGHRKSKSLNAR